jgi:hypothetical protein
LRWDGVLSASGTIAPAPDEALEQCKLTGKNRCTKRETCSNSASVAVTLLRRLVAGFQQRGPYSSPGQIMWDLWKTKWHLGRFSPSTSGFPAKHSTDCPPHSSSSGAGTIGQIVDSVPLRHPKKGKKKISTSCKSSPK